MINLTRLKLRTSVHLKSNINRVKKQAPGGNKFSTHIAKQKNVVV